MAERMLLSNLDKNLLLYAGLVGGVVAVIAYRRRHQGWQIDRARLAASVNAPRPWLRVRSGGTQRAIALRSEEHTSELQSLMRISYAVFCLKKKNTMHQN